MSLEGAAASTFAWRETGRRGRPDLTVRAAQI
jgi:hypothetical protein